MDYLTKKRFSIAFRRWLLGKSPSKRLTAILQTDRQTYTAFFEQFFNDKINWGNYGSTWHIDHIVPTPLFNDNEVILCWSRENLQPLITKNNQIKGSSITKELAELNLRLKYNPSNPVLPILIDKLNSFSARQSLDDSFYQTLKF